MNMNLYSRMFFFLPQIYFLEHFSYMFLCFRPDEFKFGCTSLRVPPDLLYQLRNDITVSPNGIAFVKVLMRLHSTLVPQWPH